MGSIFKPKMPPLPPVQPMPEPPSSELSDAEKAQIKKDKDAVERKRKGRRSTILTGSGLNEIEDANVDKKTLLG